MVNNEWQPAVILERPCSGIPFNDEKWHRAQGTVVRIKPAIPEIEEMRSMCITKTWFLVHPDDSTKLLKEINGGNVFVCEHQILTD